MGVEGVGEEGVRSKGCKGNGKGKGAYIKEL